MKNINFSEWIDAANNSRLREFRSAVHIVITAIATSPTLPNHLVMKGGILLALAHHGIRYTRDIDFSTEVTVRALPVELIKKEIETSLISAVELLEYDLDCRVQSSELRPPDPKKAWPTYIMKIGYAPYSNQKRHARLQSGLSTDVVKLECSYNEKMSFLEALEILPGKNVRAYALTDLLAEKLRAMIQQPIRDRYRRQDVYDVFMLLNEYSEIDEEEKRKILKSLRAKAGSRNIEISSESLRNPEIKRRAQRDYGQLKSEIAGDLPDFEQSFSAVQEFYESLPWTD